MFRTAAAILLSLIITNKLKSNTFDIRDFGADTITGKINTHAIQSAIDQCSEIGGMVYIPSGVFYTGSLELKSNVTLYLENGAVLLGSNKASDYPIHPPEFDSYTNNYQLCALLFAENCENITITGKGKVDCNGGSGDFFMTHEEWKEAENERKRPFGILMRRCKNVTISGITLENSAFWMQQYLECENLRFENLTIINHANYNNDGMDINNCRDVVIHACRIYCSDDAIAIKSTTESINENIVISDCVLRSHYNGFKIGTETNGGVKNLVMNNCIIGSPGYKNHHGPNDLGYCGIAIQSNDGARIENISISNVSIDSMMTPFFIRLQNRGRKISKNHETQPPGIIKNINLSNILATNMTKLASSITGIPGHYVENVKFSNIQIYTSGGGSRSDFDKPVPEKESAYPDVTMFGTNLPAYGFFIRHANNIFFTDIFLQTVTIDERPSFYLEDVSNSRFSNIITDPERTMESVFEIRESKKIILPLEN